MSGDRIFIVKGRRDSVCLISASFLPFPCFNFYLFLVSSKCWLFGNAGVDKTYVSWKIFKAVSEHCTCHSEQTPSELNHRLHVCVWACYSALLPTPVLVDQFSCFLHYCTAALLHSTLLHVLLLCVDIKMCVQNTDIHCIGRLVVIFSLFFFTLCHRILLCFNEECRWFCSETFLPSPDIDTESVMRWLTCLSWLLGSGTISGSLRLHLFDK